MLDIKRIIIHIEYLDYTNVFFLDSAVELPKYININNHLIDLINDKQLSHSLIYSLGQVELKMLKIYIKTNLVNDFIRLFKSPAGILILFIYKKNGYL